MILYYLRNNQLAGIEWSTLHQSFFTKLQRETWEHEPDYHHRKQLLHGKIIGGFVTKLPTSHQEMVCLLLINYYGGSKCHDRLMC